MLGIATLFRNTKGFSIIEILVVIPTIIILAFFLAYLVSYQSWVFNATNAELSMTNDAREALDTIDTYVRESSQVLQSYSTFSSSSTTVILQLESIDPSGNTLSGKYDTVVAYLSGTNLNLQVFPDPSSSRASETIILAQNVNPSDFSFSYDNTTYSLVRIVTTTIVLQQATGTTTRSITLSSQATLRNYQ